MKHEAARKSRARLREKRARAGALRRVEWPETAVTASADFERYAKNHSHYKMQSRTWTCSPLPLPDPFSGRVKWWFDAPWELSAARKGRPQTRFESKLLRVLQGNPVELNAFISGAGTNTHGFHIMLDDFEEIRAFFQDRYPAAHAALAGGKFDEDVLMGSHPDIEAVFAQEFKRQQSCIQEAANRTLADLRVAFPKLTAADIERVVGVVHRCRHNCCDVPTDDDDDDESD